MIRVSHRRHATEFCCRLNGNETVQLVQQSHATEYCSHDDHTSCPSDVGDVRHHSITVTVSANKITAKQINTSAVQTWKTT